MLQNLSTELESFRKNNNEMQAEYNHTATCIIQPNLYMEVFAIIEIDWDKVILLLTYLHVSKKLRSP